MQQMTSSHAKQNFGELLDAVASGPVAIERHKKVRAIVCSPEMFAARADRDGLLTERRMARATQALLEKDRLIGHQRLAIELLSASPARREALLARARDEVARWRREHLCSVDYIDRWEHMLTLPVADLAQTMCSDSMDWATALRQNSPWPAVLA